MKSYIIVGVAILNLTGCYAASQEDPCRGGLWGFDEAQCIQRLQAKEAALLEGERVSQQVKMENYHLMNERKIKIRELERKKAEFQALDAQTNKVYQDILFYLEQIHFRLAEIDRIEEEISSLKEERTKILSGTQQIIIQQKQGQIRKLNKELDDLLDVALE